MASVGGCPISIGSCWFRKPLSALPREVAVLAQQLSCKPGWERTGTAPGGTGRAPTRLRLDMSPRPGNEALLIKTLSGLIFS